MCFLRLKSFVAQWAYLRSHTNGHGVTQMRTSNRIDMVEEYCTRCEEVYRCQTLPRRRRTRGASAALGDSGVLRMADTSTAASRANA
jgi:hypothetical protein